MKQKCKHLTCTNTVPLRTKYCTEHEQQKAPVLKYRPDEHKFYNTTAWRELSKKTRARYPICEKCNKALSDVVDHIYEIRYPNGDKYKLNPKNCIAVCHGCHNNKTKEIQKTIRVDKNDQTEVTPSTFRFLKQYVTRAEQLDLIEEIQLQEEERTKDDSQGKG